ncbi:MAG: hypothetical protein ACI9EF_001143 [Pseudohongiellaceae bacterium]
MGAVFDLTMLGLAMDVVGVIFLANSMGIRHPRRFLNEHFGVEARKPLRAVHQQLRVKAQIFTGFLFLTVGFSLAMMANISQPSGPQTVALDSGTQARAMLVLVIAIVAVTFGLRWLQNAWSLRVFRRLLREFFQEHSDWAFEKHPNDTRDIGEILGVVHLGEDSIGDYSARVRSALGLAPGKRQRHRSRAMSDDAFAPLRKMGADRRA